ncbi:MAG: hypothetical protein KTR33_16230 [Gammaproteobacteria bacterium]|nr:hypothetical protein [Gammaproteobacteria bacterium]
MAKLPVRPKSEVHATASYSRVLRDMVPTAEKELAKTDFMRSLSRVRENEKSPAQRGEDKYAAVDKTQRAHTPVGRNPSQSAPAAPVLPRHENTHAILPGSARPAALHQHQHRHNEPARRPTDSLSRPRTPEIITPAEVAPASVDTTELHPVLRRRKPSIENVDTGVASPQSVLASLQEKAGTSLNTIGERGSVTDLGVFSTIDTMLRQLDLLDSAQLSSTWRFTLAYPGHDSVRVALRAEENGSWAIDLKTSDEAVASSYIEELRSSLERRRDIASISVNAGVGE